MQPRPDQNLVCILRLPLNHRATWSFPLGLKVFSAVPGFHGFQCLKIIGVEQVHSHSLSLLSVPAVFLLLFLFVLSSLQCLAVARAGLGPEMFCLSSPSAGYWCWASLACCSFFCQKLCSGEYSTQVMIYNNSYSKLVFLDWAVVAYTFNPSTLSSRQVDL